MYKKMIVAIATGIMMASLSISALAADASGKITKVEGSTVTIKVEQGMAEWVKKGSAVKVAGGMAKIVAVEGDLVTLKSPKVAKQGVGATVILEQRAGKA